MKSKKILSVILAFVGVVAIVLGIVCFCLDSGSYVSSKSYGGDAYTGIQNAGAATARNVRDLGDIVKTGFGSVLVVAGLAFAGIGVCGLISEKKKDQPIPVTPAASTAVEATESLKNHADEQPVEESGTSEVKED